MLAAIVAVACSPSPNQPPIQKPLTKDRSILEPLQLYSDQPRQRRIYHGEVHAYAVTLERGDMLEVEAEQLAGDVSLAMFSPTRQVVVRVDHENRANVSENLVFVADETGEHRLQIEVWEAEGEYRIRRLPSRDPGPVDRIRAAAERSFSEAEALSPVDFELAVNEYRAAAELWRQAADEKSEARAWQRLGQALPHGRELRQDKLAAYIRASELYRRVGVVAQQARCLHELGKISRQSGDLDSARRHYSRSLDLWREVADQHEVSVLAYELAGVERRLGHPETARRHYREALQVARHNVSPALHEARIRTDLGALYQYRGQTRESLDEMRRALRLLEQPTSASAEKIKAQRARTLTRLGNVLAALATEEALTEAGELLEQARQLRQELGQRAGIATTANSLGLLYERMNRPRAALAAFEQAEELFQELRKTASAAVVQGNRCRTVERFGHLEQARDCYLEVLTELQRAGYQNATGQALVDLAKNARRRNALLEARTWIGEALEVVEAIREESSSSDLRAAFLDRKYDVYQLAIDLALDLHASDGEADHSAEAFDLLEGARARSFLESMARFRPERQVPRPVEELRSAIYRAKVASLASSEEGSHEVERLERELGALLEKLQLTDSGPDVVEPDILSLGEVQRLLDSDTVLLEYYLGESRSAVWAITDSRIVYRPLPPGAAIEATARSLYEAMRGGAHRIRSWKFERFSRELSGMILAPVVDLLDRPRLAVVPDGALRYIPFAALPHPALGDANPEPLLLTHQITSTPSASVLAALRSRAAGRAPAPDLMALIAAPVAQYDAGRPADEHSPRVTPLPHVAEEAAAILEMTAGEKVRVAIGTAATREFVLSGTLGKARIIHFATHGHLDDEQGELSGLMLSQVDAEGRRTGGYVWAYEIYRLNLTADLVVLSACDTALGEPIRGEGLVGLTRGFLEAGAQRVLVSLWSVSDRSTARLMEFFYSRLLQEELDAPEALRQAQIALRRSGFAAPFHWAAFVLEGDWRPAAGRRTSQVSTEKKPTRF